MENIQTKAEWVLKELLAVQKKYEGKQTDTFAINIGAMAKDCADVIEDLRRENAILLKELDASTRELLITIQEYGSGPIPRMLVPEGLHPEGLHPEMSGPDEATEHNYLLDKMRGQMRQKG